MTSDSGQRTSSLPSVLRELREQFDLPSAGDALRHGRRNGLRLGERPQRAGPYRVRPDRRGRFDGYLRNVALNKVLLTNERWPFVLATPLHADVIVGIDVKHHTAGFTVIGKHGSEVRTLSRKSRQKEMLLADQVTTYLMELLRAEAKYAEIRTIVLHRDGRLWPSERAAHARWSGSRQKVVLPADATLTMLEVSKTSPGLAPPV